MSKLLSERVQKRRLPYGNRPSKNLRGGERGIRILFFNILTPFHMCLIPPIIHFYNEILVYKICFSPSQLSHTILSVSPRCNFFIAKMHQNPPHSYPSNLLKTNKIIIIYRKHTFSLERFFSISHFLML